MSEQTSASGRIALAGVSKRYRIAEVTVNALDDVDLVIDDGSFSVVLGASGSGKTTLLNMIGALDIPSEGTITVDGTDLSRANRAERARFRRQSVSFVFQSFNLFAGLTAAENVRFGADAARRPDAPEVVARSLESVGLSERGDHFPHQLSGGEQQRVAIARALATGNRILLADEPTGELDFTTGVQILKALETQARAGMTVVIVTHNREISRIADRVVELSSGSIISDGPPSGGRAEISELQW